MKSSEGGLPVRGVRLGAVRAPVYENKDRDDLLLMAFDDGSVGACVAVGRAVVGVEPSVNPLATFSCA